VDFRKKKKKGNRTFTPQKDLSKDREVLEVLGLLAGESRYQPSPIMGEEQVPKLRYRKMAKQYWRRWVGEGRRKDLKK